MARISILVASVALAAGLGAIGAMATPTDPGGTFLDDDGNVHEPSIEAVADREITVGCDRAGTVYCPSQPVSRAQMATFLARALDLPAATSDHFTDDTNSTHEENINRVADAEISLGCGGTNYCPDAGLTRAQMATFLARALDLPAATSDHFTDDTNSTHEENINRVADAEISLGCGGTNYCPQDTLTRAQMATFLTRALDLTPLDPAPRPQTTTGIQLATFEFTFDCAEDIDCPGELSVPVDSAFFVLEGWDLENWSISSELDRQAFEDPATRTDFSFNGGDALNTEETFEVDANDTAQKRYSFQFPGSLTGTHELEVRWYQSNVLRFSVIVELTIET